VVNQFEGACCEAMLTGADVSLASDELALAHEAVCKLAVSSLPHFVEVQ